MISYRFQLPASLFVDVHADSPQAAWETFNSTRAALADGVDPDKLPPVFGTPNLIADDQDFREAELIDWLDEGGYFARIDDVARVRVNPLREEQDTLPDPATDPNHGAPSQTWFCR